MKTLLFLPLIAAAALVGITFGITPDPDDGRGAPSGVHQFDATEKARLLDLSAKALERCLRRRVDGIASSIVMGTQGSVQLEWRNFVIRQFILGTLSERDIERGVTRRIYAQFSWDSYRALTPERGEWSAWHTSHCPYFPSHLVIEEVDGRFELASSDLVHIHPGPAAGDDGDLMPHERVAARR